MFHNAWEFFTTGKVTANYSQEYQISVYILIDLTGENVFQYEPEMYFLWPGGYIFQLVR